MADIKLREVNRGTIKTLDRSIAASNRIRNVGEEIRSKSKDVQKPDEGSLNEYATGRIEHGMQESAYVARRIGAKASPHVKTGAKNAISSARIRYAKGQLKCERALNLPLKFTYFRERRWQKWLNLRLYGILPSTSDSLKMMNLRVNLTVFPIRKST